MNRHRDVDARTVRALGSDADQSVHPRRARALGAYDGQSGAVIHVVLRELELGQELGDHPDGAPRGAGAIAEPGVLLQRDGVLRDHVVVDLRVLPEVDGLEVEVVGAILHEVHDVRVFEEGRRARHILGVVEFLVELRERAVGLLKVVAVPDEDDADLHDHGHLVLAFEEHGVASLASVSPLLDGDEGVEEEDLVRPGLFELLDGDEVEPGVQPLGARVEALVGRWRGLLGSSRTHVR